jgi:hypothetical protein
MKMIKILLLALLLSGSSVSCIYNDATNEQIAACVFICDSLNAKMIYGKIQNDGENTTCGCVREFRINKDGNNFTEITKEPDSAPKTNPPSSTANTPPTGHI